MCYSALIEADYRKYVRKFGATVSLAEFTEQAMADPGKGKVPRWPKAMRDAAAADPSPEAAPLREAVRAWIAHDTAELEQELFKQTRRVADGQRALAAKPTKKAAEDVRIGSSKVDQIKARLADLKRSEPLPRDGRIYPGYYAPVMVWQEGQRVVLPMRYQCRPAGKPEVYDRKYPGTYNARSDNLEGFWKGLYGKTHGVVLASAFYEHVQQDGKDVVLEFRPQTGGEMLVACLWSSWIGKDGEELLSFAAITDDPPPEVAAAGHDRCIIPIKPENLDAWLRPDPANLPAQYAILHDRERPYYEHREAA